MLEAKIAVSPIYRVGRHPDPWAPPDWSHGTGGTFGGPFGNRFDDPEGYYRVIYAAGVRVSCFLETLARFRPDLTLLAELEEIEGDNDFFPIGQVPDEWVDNRVMGTCNFKGSYAEIYAAEWVTHVRAKLSDLCIRLGFPDLDCRASPARSAA